MPGPVRFAVRLPQSWCVASRDALVAVTDLAEELDMDISVQDHLLTDGSVSPCGHAHPPHADDRAVFEAHTTLAYLAGRTRRARLIAGVYVLPFRHPIWLAKETSTLDALSDGRLVVGVGVGALRGRREDRGQKLQAHGSIAAREFDTFAVRGNRGRMMDEYIRVLDTLWTRRPANFDGEFVRFTDLDILPRPVAAPRPPIWVGGRSDAAVSRAARLAEAWYPSQAPVEVIEVGRPELTRLAGKAGRPAPTVAVNLFASVMPRTDEAREAVRDGIGHRFQGDAPLFAATLAGTPDEVRAHAQRYVDAGVTTFDLKYLPLTLEQTLAQMRLVAMEVAPGVTPRNAPKGG